MSSLSLIQHRDSLEEVQAVLDEVEANLIKFTDKTIQEDHCFFSSRKDRGCNKFKYFVNIYRNKQNAKVFDILKDKFNHIFKEDSDSSFILNEKNP
tara:strand:+ start:30 stop:317 length:288 start_codon:yes stop_codon:yes gene_type:complete